MISSAFSKIIVSRFPACPFARQFADLMPGFPFLPLLDLPQDAAAFLPLCFISGSASRGLLIQPHLQTTFRFAGPGKQETSSRY